MKRIKLTAGEAGEQLETLIIQHLKEELFLYRAEANEQVFYTEIGDHLRSLEAGTPVTLVFYTEIELTAVTLAEARRFIAHWTKELPGLANTFYAGHGSLGSLAQLAEALAWLQAVSSQLADRDFDLAGWPERLTAALRELLRITEENQSVALGDFLLYELQGTLEGLHDRLVQIELAAGEVT